jgi:hypothetical protein
VGRAAHSAVLRAGTITARTAAESLANPRYRCRHGYTSVTRPEPGRPGNTHIREDQILPRLAPIAILLAAAPPNRAGRRWHDWPLGGCYA